MEERVNIWGDIKAGKRMIELAKKAFENGEPSNPPHTGKEKSELK